MRIDIKLCVCVSVPARVLRKERGPREDGKMQQSGDAETCITSSLES